MVVEGWYNDIRWACVRRGSEGIGIRELVACRGGDVEGECVVDVMAQDLSVVGGFEAVIKLDQHVSHGGCGLVGELRKFDLQLDSRTCSTARGHGYFLVRHDLGSSHRAAARALGRAVCVVELGGANTSRYSLSSSAGSWRCAATASS